MRGLTENVSITKSIIAKKLIEIESIIITSVQPELHSD